MSLRRSLSREGIAHANADSITHARHVEDRKNRRKLEWVAEPVDQADGTEIFRLKSPERLGLSKGRYFVGIDEEVGGTDFERYCNEINRQRSWYRGMMKRGKSRRPVRRKKKSPACTEVVVNFHPAQMLFIQKLLNGWEANGIQPDRRRELLESLVDDLRRGILTEFRAASNWETVGSYIHYDSNKIHIGLIVSRVSSDNRLSSERSLGTVGAWSVGQQRLRKLGLVDPSDLRLSENLQRFRAKFGDRTPLDLRLHNHLDADFEQIVARLSAENLYKQSEKEYIAWKMKSRREAFSRSPGALGVAWGLLRHISPLLPPGLQAALSVSRTALQAFQILDSALATAQKTKLTALADFLANYEPKQRKPDSPSRRT